MAKHITAGERQKRRTITELTDIAERIAVVLSYTEYTPGGQPLEFEELGGVTSCTDAPSASFGIETGNGARVIVTVTPAPDYKAMP